MTGTGTVGGALPWRRELLVTQVALVATGGHLSSLLLVLGFVGRGIGGGGTIGVVLIVALMAMRLFMRARRGGRGGRGGRRGGPWY